MVYNESGQTAVISYTKKTDGSYDFSPSKLRFVNISTNNMVQYNCDTTEIRHIKAADIRTYKNDGDDAHYIVAHTANFSPKTIVLYEKTEVR